MLDSVTASRPRTPELAAHFGGFDFRLELPRREMSRILQRSKLRRPRSSEYWSAKLRTYRISPVAVCAVTVNRRLYERLTPIQM